MMEFSVSISGPEVAARISQDEEEFAYFLNELKHSVDESFMTEVVETIPYGENERIAKHLRMMADKVENFPAEVKPPFSAEHFITRLLEHEEDDHNLRARLKDWNEGAWNDALEDLGE